MNLWEVDPCQINTCTAQQVAKTSEVDDQLFAAKGQQFHNEHMENIQYLQGLQKHNKPWLSPPEERSVILTEEQRLALKKHKEAERDRIHAVANQRKQMMLKASHPRSCDSDILGMLVQFSARNMEAERRKKSGRLTDAEILRMQNEDRTKAEALRQMEENLDDAKLMNRMMNYARCVTIRDGQLHEKGDKERWEEQDKMRWHHIMEMSRVQKIKEHDTAEARKKYFRYEGAAVIRKQMAENESMRKINEEIKEQEGRKIRRESERMLKEDQDIAEAKRIAGRKLLIEILKANDDAQEARIKAKEFEKEEEARRQVYVHEKEKRDLAYQEAQDKIKKEREMETARQAELQLDLSVVLRALQERAQDKQAVIDGVRALRVQEEHEREWREKERAEAEKIRLMYEDLARAREEQKIYKLKLLADQAQEEQIAYYRIAQSQKAALIEARRQAEAAHEANIKNKEAVIKQIEQNAEKRARAFREKFEEGERLRQQIRVEKLRLEDIKERKLKVLAKEGVPPKYQVELAKHKIVIH
ncbi:hypothetical protein AXG93_1944s1020 [Marchantia polymorpha subsp. ruderalis]|uniref:Cilia- and flagella-associated protein 45 n=1 Tax=Marchantia polymorpha subsp. ruderalis TaxID=1480154 RepID=A0A176VGF2_MARPO|nr:hypothetical protein AXG93_1944s1020 [Marchantia polymorpha subsp. ruderalis]